MYTQKENELQGVGAGTSSLNTMISIWQGIVLADDSAWRTQLKVRGFTALIVAALAGCSSTPASTSASKADPQQSRIVRNESLPIPKTRAVAAASVSAPPVRAATAANILDVCDRSISGGMKKNHVIQLWELKDNPNEKNTQSIRESIKLLERNNIEMNCKVIDAGKSVYLYSQAIDFVMMRAKKENVLKDIYDIEFHQIAMAVKLGGNQMILDGNFGAFHSESSKFVSLMFKEIVRLRKKYQKSQEAIDSANRTLVGVMAGIASYVLIAKALNRILPEIPASSGATGIGAASDFCSHSDTCFSAIANNKGAVTIQCTRGKYRGESKKICGPNAKGKWAAGCGYSDIFAYHYNYKEAGNRACGQ